MLRHSRYVVACCGAIFGLTSFLIGLEVSATTAPALNKEAVTVDRTLKGDRLVVNQINRRNAVNGPVEIKTPRAPVKPELPEGCEPVVSAIGQSPLSRIPGRCVS
jgi:hypothetical protein